MLELLKYYADVIRDNIYPIVANIVHLLHSSSPFAIVVK